MVRWSRYKDKASIMDWENNVVFKLAFGIAGDYICALLIEKGVSILQNRKFQFRYAFGIFLIVLAATAIVKGILLH